MTTTMNDVRTLESQHVLQTYKRLPVVFERGEGVRLFDDQGRAYLDFVSGIGVAALGHAHPALARALADQATTLVHTSNLYFHPLQGELATRLSALTGLERAFFCNSGTEAVEACLKFARRFWSRKARSAGRSSSRSSIRSTAARWARCRDVGRALPRAVRAADSGRVVASAADPASLDALVDAETAAIIVEPIQGEGGVRPIPPRRSRDRRGGAAHGAPC
jgi:acetylornithine/succinyldiaminopimelate/putrescine aminotransferase